MFSATKGGSPSGYQISRSVRLRSSASAYFNRTPASAGNRKTWTWSGWVKRSRTTSSVPDEDRLFNVTGSGTDTTLFSILFDASTAKLAVVTGATTFRVTTAVYRDPSAWYHILVALDTTQATAANRLRLYVNGLEVTAFDTNNAPTQNTDYGINQGSVEHFIGRYSATTPNRYFDGYLTEVNFIDGQALTPASFGETDAVTGVWKPKKYAGTYGTNGFYLNFSDNSAATAATIGKDYSGNGNNWTPNNISVTAGATYDSMLDVPTPWADGGNGRGNYATLNPLTTTAGTYSSANLRYVGASAWRRSNATISVSTGKWYWEVTLGNAPYSPRGSTTSYNALGFGLSTVFNSTTSSSGVTDAVILADNGYYKNFSGSWTDGGTGFSSGDTLAVAVDLDANTFTFYRNNTQVTTGTIGGTAGRELVPIILSYDGSYGVMDCNFGQRPFAYTPPSGFKALNTQNLPEPTIKKGNQYFDVSLYTGTGSALSVTNSGSMQPDLVWIKGRSAAYEHALFDSVRGARNLLRSNSTGAEVLETAGTSLTSFDSGGFSLGTNGATASTNVNGSTFVGWQWKEGATQGFDIVTYTGTGSAATTVAHGLGVVPAMIITKRRNSTGEWMVKHKSLASNLNLILNQTSATYNTTVGAGGGIADLTSSTTFGFVQGSTNTDNSNANGGTYVAYLFAAVSGFSAFGSLSANAAADNAFAFTGFLPRFVMLKRTDSTSNWIMWDTARNTFNVLGAELYPNLSNAEATVTGLDLVSNGFKLRSTSFTGTWIYAAFAAVPFKYSLAF